MSEKIRIDEIFEGGIAKFSSQFHEPFKEQIRLINDLNDLFVKQAKLLKNDLNKSGNKPNLNALAKEAKAREQLNNIQLESEKLMTMKLRAQKKLEQAQSKEHKEILKLRLETNEVNRAIREEIKLNKLAVNSNDRLRAQNKQLIRQKDALAGATKEEIEQIQRLNKQIEHNTSIIRARGDEYTKQGIAARTQIKTLGGIKTAYLKASVAGAALISSTKGVFEISEKQDQIVKQLSSTWSVQGKDIDALATKVTYLGDAYKSEYNEVIESANSLTSEFKISGKEALSLIDQGFEKGANIRGKFLELVKEYSTQFVNVGISAKEAIAIITQTELRGVFSDKGVDSIKEAGLTLERMPKSAAKALNDLGISSENLRQEIEAGSITTYQAIQTISNKMAELPPNSKKVSEVLSSVFRSAGEDSKGFILELGKIDLSLDKLATTTTDFEKSQQDLYASFAEVKREIAKGFLPISNYLAKNLKTILRVSIAAGAAWISYKATINSARLATALYTTATRAHVIVQSLMIKGIKGSTIALKAFNKTARLNPLGLLISLIGSAVAWLSSFALSTDTATESSEGYNKSLVQGNTQLDKRINLQKEFDKANTKIEKDLRHIQSLTDKQLKSLLDQAEAQLDLSEKKHLAALNEIEDSKELWQEQDRLFEAENRLLELRKEMDNGPTLERELEIRQELQILELTNLEALKERSKERIKQRDDEDRSTRHRIELIKKELATRHNVQKAEISHLKKLEDRLKEVNDLKELEIGDGKGANSERFKSLENEEAYLIRKIKFLREALDLNKEITSEELKKIPVIKSTSIEQENSDKDREKNVVKINDNITKQHIAENDLAEQRRKILKESIGMTAQLAKELEPVLTSALARNTELLKEQISGSAEMERSLLDLASQGQQDAEKSIAAEREKQNQAKREIAQQEKKIQKRKAFIASMELLAAFASSDPGSAAQNTGHSILQTSALVEQLPGFFTGTITTVADALGKPQIDGKDGYIIRADGGEAILNSANTKKAGISQGFTVDDLAELGNLAHQGRLVPITNAMLAVHKSPLADRRMETPTLQLNKLLTETRQTRNSIEKLPSQMPNVTFHANSISQAVTKEVQRPGFKSRTHIRIKGRKGGFA